METNATVTWREKLGCLVIALIVVFVAMIIPDPSVILFFGYFPTPLMWFPAMAIGSEYNVDSWLGLFAGWGIYAGLLACILGSRSRAVYRRFFMILCVLLLLNVAGCHALLHDLRNLHLGCEMAPHTELVSR